MDFAICPVFKAPRGHGYPNHGSAPLCLFGTHSMWHHMGIYNPYWLSVHPLVASLEDASSLYAGIGCWFTSICGIFVGKKWKKLENRWETIEKRSLLDCEVQKINQNKGLVENKGSWCMSQHAILVHGWPPPHCLKELCPHFTGQKVHGCPVSLPGWSVGYLLALNTPRIFPC